MSIFEHLSRKTCITKSINKLKSGRDSGPPCRTPIDNSKLLTGVVYEYCDSISWTSFVFDVGAYL